jgi:hypothetical protein
MDPAFAHTLYALQAALGTQLPSIHKNPFAIEETRSDDAFTSERMVNVLKDSRFFKDLDAAVLETLPKHAKFLNVPNGAVLFRQGILLRDVTSS